MSEKDIKGLTTKELQEKLKKIEQDFDKLTNEYEDEIERLNNIIETLEEELQSEIDIPFKNLNLEYNTYIDIRETLKKVLRRIKELKENK